MCLVYCVVCFYGWVMVCFGSRSCFVVCVLGVVWVFWYRWCSRFCVCWLVVCEVCCGCCCFIVC